MSTPTAQYSQAHPDFYESVQKSRRPDKRGYYAAKAVEAARNFALTVQSSFFDDDVVADLGGSQGYASEALREALHCQPIIIDLNEADLALAAERGFPTCCAHLDKVPLLDLAIDWGFCSHVLEHVEDLDATAAELTRLVRRGLYLVVPLESKDSFERNPEHMRYSETPELYVAPFTSRGWREGFRIPASDDRSDCQVWLYR